MQKTLQLNEKYMDETKVHYKKEWPKNAMHMGQWRQVYLANEEYINHAQSIYPKLEAINIKYAQSRYNIWDEYLKRLNYQFNLVKYVGSFIPINVFNTIISKLSRTSYDDYITYKDHVKLYWDQYITYLKSKNAFGSIRYFSVMDEKDIPKTDKEFDDKKKKLNEMGINGSNLDKFFKPIDLSDLPKFNEIHISLAETIKDSLNFIIILFFMNALLIMVAIVSFLRKEIK
jgi:hypothetical protein